MAEKDEDRGRGTEDFKKFLGERRAVDETMRRVRLRGRLLSSGVEDRFILWPWGSRFVIEARVSDVVEFRQLEGPDSDLVEVELEPDAEVRQAVVTSASEAGEWAYTSWKDPGVYGYAAWKEPPGPWGYASWKEPPGPWGYASWKEPPGPWGYAAWKEAPGAWGYRGLSSW